MESTHAVLDNIQRARQGSGLAAMEAPACETCRDSGWERTPKGLKPCACREPRQADAKLIAAKVPPRFREFRLSSLQPDANRSPRQAEALRALRAYPWAEKIHIYGATKGAGKSLLGWCLMMQALENNLPAYGIETDLLLQQLHQAAVNQNAPRPYLLPEDLMRERKRKDLPTGCLVLDEAEKANFTEFNSRQLFQVLQQAVNWCWQIVIISNVDADLLQTIWQQAGNNIGEAIARRALENYFPIHL